METVTKKTAILITDENAFVKVYEQTLAELSYYKLRKMFDKVFIIAGSYEAQRKLLKLFHEDILVNLHSRKNLLSAMLTGLKICRSEYVFVTICTMPLINAKVVEKILAEQGKGFSAIIPRYVNGKLEVMHSLYKVKPVLRCLENAYNDENFNIANALQSLQNIFYLPVGELMGLDPKLESFFKAKDEIDLETLKDRFKKRTFKKRLQKADILAPEILKELETESSIYFKAPGTEEGEHDVRFNKRKNVWMCDCTHYTMKGTYCSHILAAQRLVK